MTFKEKVVKGLKCCVWENCDEPCPYVTERECTEKLFKDITGALKPQRKARKKVPCTCGMKKLKKIYSRQSNGRISIEMRCPICGRSVTGYSDVGVTQAWNNMIKAERRIIIDEWNR